MFFLSKERSLGSETHSKGELIVLQFYLQFSSSYLHICFVFTAGFLWHFLMEVATFQSRVKCDANIQTDHQLPTEITASLGIYVVCMHSIAFVVCSPLIK